MAQWRRLRGPVVAGADVHLPDVDAGMSPGQMMAASWCTKPAALLRLAR
jgi:hypothetical protein